MKDFILSLLYSAVHSIGYLNNTQHNNFLPFFLKVSMLSFQLTPPFLHFVAFPAMPDFMIFPRISFCSSIKHFSGFHQSSHEFLARVDTFLCVLLNAAESLIQTHMIQHTDCFNSSWYLHGE